MAEYILEIENDSASGNYYTNSSKGAPLSAVDSLIAEKIPKHSVINSAVQSITVRQNLSLSNGDINLGFMSTNDFSASVYSGTDAVTNSYKTFTANYMPYIHTSGEKAGKFNVSHYAFGRQFKASVNRRWYWKEHKYTVNYTKPVYVISLSAGEGGTVSGSGSFEVGIDDFTHTITAQPSDGYRFVRWSDASTEQSRNIIISQNSISAHRTSVNFTAEFERINSFPVFKSVEISPNPANAGQGIILSALIE